MNLSFRQLRVFIEVARHASVQRAAAALHITPPAVSMQIKELENQLGLRLFDRDKRRLSLSTAGEYFLVHARRMLAAHKEAEDAMARLQHLQRGMLTLGFVSTAKYFLLRLLHDFTVEHPGVELRLRVAHNRDALTAQLRGNEIDLAVMGRPPRELGTRAEPFAAHPLVLVAPAGHPLTHLAHLPAEALEPYPLLLREPGSGTRAALEEFLTRQRITPRSSMEIGSNETHKQAVIAGMGISLLSLHSIGLELRGGLLHVLDVEGTPLMRSWFVVQQSARQLAPAAEAFRYFILERGETWLAAHDAALLGERSGAAAADLPLRHALD